MKATITFTGATGFAKHDIFDDSYLTRLRNGDEETASHFLVYFRRLLQRWLWGKLGREQEEELVDSTITAAFEKISKGHPRNAAKLPAYVTGICLNLTRLAIRRGNKTDARDVEAFPIHDQSPSVEQRLLQQERAHEVAEVLRTLGKRDRDILVDLFYRDKDRDQVCQEHGVDREALRLILFRAKKRFQSKCRGPLLTRPS